MPRSVQTSRRRSSQAVYAGRSKPALRPLSMSVESVGALAFGCSACSGLTSTQAMSLRVRRTRIVSSSMSLSV